MVNSGTRGRRVPENGHCGRASPMPLATRRAIRKMRLARAEDPALAVAANLRIQQRVDKADGIHVGAENVRFPDVGKASASAQYPHHLVVHAVQIEPAALSAPTLGFG